MLLMLLILLLLLPVMAVWNHDIDLELAVVTLNRLLLSFRIVCLPLIGFNI